MKNSLNSSRKSGPLDINKLIILQVLFCYCWSLLVSVSVSRAIWQSCVKCHIIDWYTVSFAAGGLSKTLQYAHRVRDSERSMPGLTASVQALAIEIVVLQHRGSEKPSQMCEIPFMWSCPMWPSRWGMPISINWPRVVRQTAMNEQGEKFAPASRRMGAVLTYGADGGCASLKFGVFVCDDDSCYFFSLPQWCLFYPNIRAIRVLYCICIFYNFSILRWCR